MFRESGWHRSKTDSTLNDKPARFAFALRETYADHDIGEAITNLDFESWDHIHLSAAF